MNVNLYGCDGKWVMVDLRHDLRRSRILPRHRPDPAGPRASSRSSRKERWLGIVLTHGHEDHIGAIPYLAADLGVPLYATPFTAGLIRGEARRGAPLGHRVKLRNIVRDLGSRFRARGRSASPTFRSPTRFAEGNALLIDTPARTGVPHRRLEDRSMPRRSARRPSAEELTAIGDSRHPRDDRRFDERVQSTPGVRIGGGRAFDGLKKP